MKKLNIQRSVIMATDEIDKGITFEKQNKKILQIYNKHPKKFVAFVRIVPSAGQLAIREFKQARLQGAKGLKLKAADGFKPEQAKIILDLIPKKNKFPVLIHTAHNEVSQPRLWECIIAAYPHLNFILAHGGKDHYRKCSELARSYPNVYVETSTLSFDRTKRVHRIIGASKMIFGSDYPYSHPELEMKKYTLFITNSRDLRLVFYQNAARLLGLG